MFEFGPFTVDPATGLLSRDGIPCVITPRTVALLTTLVNRRGQFVSLADIRTQVWAGRPTSNDEIDQYVTLLRDALGNPTDHRYVEGDLDRGYRFNVEVITAADTPRSTEPDHSDARPAPSVRGGPDWSLVMSAAGLLGVMTALFLVSRPQPNAMSPVGTQRDAPITSPREVRQPVASEIVTSPEGDPPLGVPAGVDSVPSTTSTPTSLDYVQGHDALALGTPDAVASAIDHYRRAIVRAPGFVEAHAELAVALGTLDAGTDPLVRQSRAVAAAERAVALDGTSPVARAALGFVRYRFQWRWSEAGQAFDTALGPRPLTSPSAIVPQLHGQYLLVVGRLRDAIAAFQRALALEPHAPGVRADLIRALLAVGRVPEARTHLDTIVGVTRSGLLAQLHADVLRAEGRLDESAAHWWDALRREGVGQSAIDALRTAYREGGDERMTRVRVAQLSAELEDGPSPPRSFRLATDLALANARLANRAEALSWLAVAIDLHEDAPLLMQSDPAFAFIRTDPQFKELLSRVNLPSGRD